jgi:hypothetical protein
MAKKPTAKQIKSRFKPGVSGNPIGRPPLGESLAEKVRAAAGDRLDKTLDLLWTRAARGDMRAIEFLADRGWGRVPVPVEQSGPAGGPVKFLVEYVDGDDGT